MNGAAPYTTRYRIHPITFTHRLSRCASKLIAKPTKTVEAPGSFSGRGYRTSIARVRAPGCVVVLVPGCDPVTINSGASGRPHPVTPSDGHCGRAGGRPLGLFGSAVDAERLVFGCVLVAVGDQGGALVAVVGRGVRCRGSRCCCRWPLIRRQSLFPLVNCGLSALKHARRMATWHNSART